MILLNGTKFSQETYDFIKAMNNKSDLEVQELSRKRNEAYSSIDRIAKEFYTLPSDITIAIGSNWYVLSCNGQDCIRVIDVVVPCAGNGIEKAESEATKYLSNNILKKAIKEKKNVSFFGYTESDSYGIMSCVFHGNERFQKDEHILDYNPARIRTGYLTYWFVGNNKQLLRQGQKKQGNKRRTTDDELPF